MLVTAYNFTLNHSLPQNLVTINKFDGKSPSLACSTTGGKILVHTPHSKDAMDPSMGMKGKDVQYLNVNKDVICLTGGRLNQNIDREVLLIGSSTNLLAYDINENADVFDKEVQDGINCMTFAPDLNPDFPMVITGGNLSLTGFDISSEEQFWTVTGDVANAMAILDFDMDNQKELVVGSDDYSIRVYKNEEMIFDINEESKVQFLSKIQKASFAYALSNGTIGVYSGSAQKWSNKVDNKITSLLGVDYEMDGSQQLMIGYQSGKFEVRKTSNGEVSYKTNMGSTVSKIMYEDYRLEGQPQVVVCNSDGDIKGYNITKNSTDFDTKDTVTKRDAAAINLMNLEIHKLKAELTDDNLEKRQAESAGVLVDMPSDVQVNITAGTMGDSACIMFKVQSPLIIRCIMLFSDKLFEEGSFVSCPGKSTNSLTIPIYSEKNMEWEIDCKIMVGKAFTSEEFMTVHQAVMFKKFGFFKNIPFNKDYSDGNAPSSHVSYKVRERPNRILLWAQKVFNIDAHNPESVVSKPDSLDFMMLHVKSNSQLVVQARSESDGTLLQISYDDMETVGDMVQDLWSFINVTDLKPEILDFPGEREKATELVENIVEYDKLRGHFSANIAESVNNAKVFVVKGEFSLMLGDMATVKKNYTVVQQENGNLIAEYTKRRNNHEELVKSLKELNNFIRKASSLRMGASKNKIGKLIISNISKCKIVTESREAIKNKKTVEVVKICLKL